MKIALTSNEKHVIWTPDGHDFEKLIFAGELKQKIKKLTITISLLDLLSQFCTIWSSSTTYLHLLSLDVLRIVFFFFEKILLAIILAIKLERFEEILKVRSFWKCWGTIFIYL